jgi:hypothetical protein
MEFTGNAVLMGVRYHKTIKQPIPAEAVTLITPIECRSGTIRDVVFAHTGAYLYGDPIYHQVRGPELPDSWWTNESQWRRFERGTYNVSTS